MNCHDFEINVLALTRGELIDSALRTRCLSHAEDCVLCAERLEEERTLLVGVRAVLAEVGKAEAPPHIQAALLIAFCQQTMAPQSPNIVPLSIHRRYVTGWRVAAITAGILLFISVIIFWHRSNIGEREVRKEPSVPSVVPGGQVLLPTLAHVEGGGDVAGQSAPRQARRHIRRQSFGGSAQEEVTQFFPLREGDDLRSLDSVWLVRVELPSSALSEVGLAVPPETASTRIKADVVLGQDGSPRAIRFVR